MPEGPEAKIVSDYINKELANSSICSFECISEPYKKKYAKLVKEINRYLPQYFSQSFCRGKNTFIKLSKGLYFSYHLGMTGYWSTKKSQHAHLKITTERSVIYFHDTRRFGNIKIITTELMNKKYNLNLDLLNSQQSIQRQSKYILSLIKTKREVCKVLLDQRYFLGVGNYLKSEILYLSDIHPNTKWNKLTIKEMKLVCINTQICMRESYKYGGAQIKDFKNPNTSSTLELSVYNKEITNKGHNIIKQKTMDNRVSFWCANNQKLIK